MKITKKKLDAYHYQAIAVASQSPDAQTKVAALLVHNDTGAVLSSGFNGFIRKTQDDKLPKTRPEKYPYMVHAEANLVCNCARHGVSMSNCFIYCTLSPCINCMRLIYQAGITLIFFKDVYTDFKKNLQMKDLHIKMSEVEDYYMAVLEPRGREYDEDFEGR